MAYQATTGLGTPTNIIVQGNQVPESTTPGYNVVTLSVSGATWPTTFQLNPSVVDASGAEQAVGTALTLTSVAGSTPAAYTLTSVAAASGTPGVAVYTGTITSGGSNAYAGRQFVITGFAASSGINNGTFQCTASSATTLTLTNANAVAETHSGSAQDQTATAVYTGTITGGGSNAFAGNVYVVAGFVTNTVNNGTFICTASSTTTLTLENPNAISETHAATATDQESTGLTYVAYSASAGVSAGTQETCVTVSSTGLITAAYKGAAVVEVSYPTFNNSIGTIVSSGNIMNGLPIMKIYAEVNVHVVA